MTAITTETLNLIPLDREDMGLPAHSPIREAFMQDRRLVLEWIDQFSDNPNTTRAFRKDGERFLLWLYREHRVRLCDVTAIDLDAYYKFLAAPAPEWCYKGGKAPRRDSPNWRPFSGPLSPASITTSMQGLRSLYQFLEEDLEVITRTPFASKKLKRKINQAVVEQKAADKDNIIEHVLWEESLDLLLDTTYQMPQRDYKEAFYRARAVFLINFAVFLAPRISEIANANMGDIHEGKARKIWWRVRGKGGRIEDVPVSTNMLIAFHEWRAVLGLSKFATRGDATPMLLKADKQSALGSSAIYKIIKQLAAQAAGNAEIDSKVHEQLSKMSPHWLRHTAITNAAESGVEERLLQKFARHARRETTDQYTHIKDSAFHDAFEDI